MRDSINLDSWIIRRADENIKNRLLTEASKETIAQQSRIGSDFGAKYK